MPGRRWAELREVVRIRKRGSLEREWAIPGADRGTCPGGASNCSGWIPALRDPFPLKQGGSPAELLRKTKETLFAS